MLIALVVSLVLVTGVFVAWLLCSANLNVAVDYPSLVFTALLVAPLHESSRMLAFPARTSSARLVFSLSKFVLRAECDGILTRNRYVAILLMPLVVVSVLPIFLFYGIGCTSPPLLACVSMFNALVSGADVLVAVAALIEVPSTAIMRFRDGTALWREQSFG